ncbi:hypothetical protein ACIA48_06895 [Mycobacterium sp. NPDC051804]|uniref:hypothetical protein n=1 Tax=Mycobacterium sp. NPDC051804 TaxID=3364295 RepID=UPI0037A8E26C
MPLPLDESNPIGSRRYQLTVVASSVADLVGSAGGWMCDKARAGWDVKVVLTDDGDTRPVAILGASHVDAELPEVIKMASLGGALAVSAGVLADDRIRAGVLGILKRGLTQVTVWGQDWPAEFSRKADPVEHKLSSAARAFKAHALSAATVSTTQVIETETLFSLGADALRPLYSV